MLRAVRFAASHDFAIEPDAWEMICELSPTISRVSPSRLYEEMLKLFLLGSARRAFGLLEKSGLLAALFPGLSKWIDGNDRHLALVLANLEWFDRLHGTDRPPTPVILLAALFGPLLEKAALARHRQGIPGPQALDETCALFVGEISEVVCVPRRVTDRLRTLLALQRSLHKMPPRRPASLAGRPEFGDALAYLHLGAETKREYQAAAEWWDTFLLESPPEASTEPPEEPAPENKRRRRRRKRRRPRQDAV
jgi:poly(A) polymerase